MDARNRKLTTLSIFLTALPLLLAGMDSLAQGNLVLGSVFVAAAVANLIILRFTVRSSKPVPSLFDILNALVLLFVAYDYHDQGKKYLPYAYVIAAVLTAVIPIVSKRSAKVNF